MACPAYQSAFILDEDYRKNLFSPFEVFEGDTVPKGFEANASDTVLVQTKPFYAQRGKRQPQQKEGFTYPKRKKKFFLTRIWSRPERPVLQNPYLLGRIFRKRPYWKLDIIKPEIIHYKRPDSITVYVPMLIDSLGQAVPDTTLLEKPFNALTVPDGYTGYNVDQIAYNRKFGHLFPKPPEPLSEEDSSKLALNLAIDGDSTASRKRRGLGLFRKKRNKDEGAVADVSSEDLNEDESEVEETTQDKKANRKKSKRKNKAKENKKKANKKKSDKPKPKKKKKKNKKKEGNEDGIRDDDDPELP